MKRNIEVSEMYVTERGLYTVKDNVTLGVAPGLYATCKKLQYLLSLVDHSVAIRSLQRLTTCIDCFMVGNTLMLSVEETMDYYKVRSKPQINLVKK